MEEIEVHIEPRVLTRQDEIWIIRRGHTDNPHGYEVAEVGDEGRVRWREHEAGVTVGHPTMVLPHGVAPLMLEELSERGIETEREATLRGEMEAQERHLEDLRELLGLGGEESRSVQVRR